MTQGIVWLVGAGPGDPELATLKAKRLIEAADVVVYDRLVDGRLLGYARRDAELIDVGKIPGKRVNRQEDINRLLIRLAGEGKRVARLKGGDPFVFGRGGEEAEALAAEGLRFEVVPGVTSAIAAPAYAGIPLTHRRMASSFTVVTGSEDPDKPDSAVDWRALARGGGTIVVLMGQANLRAIADALMRHGRDRRTPVALVQWGSEPYQRTLTGALGDIADKAAAAGFGAPAVTVVGEVARLRETIRWYDNRPLFGKRVLVTRTRAQASALCDTLARRGAQPIELPTIQIEPPDDYAELDAALADIAAYDWAIFTSANGVDAVFGRLEALGLDARALHGVKVGAIGPATAAGLRGRGIAADFMPRAFVAESVIEGMAAAYDLAGKRALLPRADIARAALSEGLAALGMRVDDVTAYRTVTPPDSAERARAVLREGVDIATFTSSSTARNLRALLDGNIDALQDVTIACIGPITARAAADMGLKVDIMASEYTIAGLVRAIESHFGQAEQENYPDE